MIGLSIWWIAAVFLISQTAFADHSGRDEDTLHFSGRRQPEDSEYRSHRRPQNNRDGSYIENVFKIPIAVIKGTAAAAQAFSPQNTDTIEKIFDIPVTTLDAVGNFIKETRPQRLSYENDEETGQRPVRLDKDRRDERRERILRIREEERLRRRLIEQERQRRRIKEQEKFFNLGNYPTLNFISGLTDLFSGDSHGFFGSHGHGHGSHGSHGSHCKPPHRPIKPSKPFKPGHHHGSHGGSAGSVEGGDEGYEVHEEIDEGPIPSSGIFSWIQTNSQSDDHKIQNKIAPGPEHRSNRDRPVFRYS